MQVYVWINSQEYTSHTTASSTKRVSFLLYFSFLLILHFMLIFFRRNKKYKTMFLDQRLHYDRCINGTDTMPMKKIQQEKEKDRCVETYAKKSFFFGISVLAEKERERIRTKRNTVWKHYRKQRRDTWHKICCIVYSFGWIHHCGVLYTPICIKKTIWYIINTCITL